MAATTARRRLPPFVGTLVKCLLAVFLMMSTGLVAITAVDVISKLAQRYAADVRDPSNSLTWRCQVCFAIITATGLVVETSILLISFATRVMGQVSFFESVAEDYGMLLRAQHGNQQNDAQWKLSRKRFQRIDQGTWISAGFLAACLFVALIYSTVIVSGSKVVPNHDITAATALASNVESFFYAFITSTITVATLAAYVCVFCLVALRALFMLASVLLWVRRNAWTWSDGCAQKRGASIQPAASLESPLGHASTRLRAAAAVALGVSYIVFWPYAAALITTASVVCSVLRKARHGACFGLNLNCQAEHRTTAGIMQPCFACRYSTAVQALLDTLPFPTRSEFILSWGGNSYVPLIFDFISANGNGGDSQWDLVRTSLSRLSASYFIFWWAASLAFSKNSVLQGGLGLVGCIGTIVMLHRWMVECSQRRLQHQHISDTVKVHERAATLPPFFTRSSKTPDTPLVTPVEAAPEAETVHHSSVVSHGDTLGPQDVGSSGCALWTNSRPHHRRKVDVAAAWGTLLIAIAVISPFSGFALIVRGGGGRVVVNQCAANAFFFAD